MFPFLGIQRALAGLPAPILTPASCAQHGRPSHCASTLFLQGVWELVPESLPGTQEGRSHSAGTMSPFGHMGLGLCSEWEVCI